MSDVRAGIEPRRRVINATDDFGVRSWEAGDEPERTDMTAQHQVLELSRGVAHASRILETYLPGLSLGLVPLTKVRLLVPASTVLALTLQYGKSQLGPILLKAGATSAMPVDDSGAIALLRVREPDELPRRAVSSQRAGLDWHLAEINAPAAWALAGGPDNIVWAGVRVGHIDTGYSPHPVFGFGTPSPWIDAGSARTFFAAQSPLDDPGPGQGIDPLAFSMDGHGTRTASTICGHAPTAAGGAFYGVAPKVPLVPVRIANHVWINHAQEEFAQAVNYLVNHAGVSVISLSMGIFLSTIRKNLRRALNTAYDAGVIVVCASGNVVQDVVAPARLSRSLAIGGVALVAGSLVPWAGGSHGPEVDISGPAEGIRRADMRHGKAIYSGGGDGTSYATALTAGAAALWLARHGATLGAQYPQRWQRVEAFKSLLRSTAHVPVPWNPGSFGSGVLDVHALLSSALPAPVAVADAPA